MASILLLAPQLSLDTPSWDVRLDSPRVNANSLSYVSLTGTFDLKSRPRLWLFLASLQLLSTRKMETTCWILTPSKLILCVEVDSKLIPESLFVLGYLGTSRLVDVPSLPRQLHSFNAAS